MILCDLRIREGSPHVALRIEPAHKEGDPLSVRLPRAVWYDPDAQARDQRSWSRILAALTAGTLLAFDLSYTNFHVFAQLTQARITFVTRAKSILVSSVAHPLRHTGTVGDAVVWIGGADRQQVRLIEVFYRSTWCRYLTNEPVPVRYAVLLDLATRSRPPSTSRPRPFPWLGCTATSTSSPPPSSGARPPTWSSTSPPTPHAWACSCANASPGPRISPIYAP